MGDGDSAAEQVMLDLLCCADIVEPPLPLPT